MQHPLKHNAIGLKIGHQVSADGGKFMGISKIGSEDREAVGFRFRKNGYGMFFRPFLASGQELPPDQETTFILEEAILDQISERTGLIFEPEMEAENKVCFANSPEVRNDFKISFSPLDLLNYAYAVLHSDSFDDEYREYLRFSSYGLPYPIDAHVFWELAESGKKIGKAYLAKPPTGK